jgi:hypothetical protein
MVLSDDVSMLAIENASNWSIVGLTTVLVAVTGFYAWTNRRAVNEMVEARRQAVLPKLSIKLHPMGPMHSKVRLVSIGLGAAVDVRVSLWFEVEGQGGYVGERRDWRQHVLAPGEFADFDVPDGPDGRLLENERLGSTYKRIHLTGEVLDVLGRRHQVDETIDDLAAWWEGVAQAGQYLPKDQLDEIAKAIRSLSK